MSYYTEEIDRRCQCGCGKRATVELKTSGTVGYGYFAKACGEREAKRRNQADARRREAADAADE